MIRTFLEKRRVRRAFEKFVDPGSVDVLLRDGRERQPIKEGRIELVLAFVRGESPSQISERMAKVADMAVEHGAVVHDLVGGLVVVAFGTLLHAPTRPDGRTLLVRALREHLAGDVKIVHGAADGHYGLFGEKRLAYTFVVP